MSRRVFTHGRMLLLGAATALLAGCAAGPTKEDPLEPFNRSMFEVNEGLNTVLVKPVAEGYVAIVPEVIRTGVSNFFGNLDDLFTGINGLLQGNGYRAGNAFGRVLLNSFMGIGGIFDLASMAGIAKDHNDFGITFGKWGFPDGPYLFIPAIGPTTVRDGTGYLVRLAVGPVGYIPDVPLRNSLYGLGYVDIRAQLLPAEAVVDTAAVDKYRFVRNAYLRARRYQLYDGKPPPEDEDDGGAVGPGGVTAPPTPSTKPEPATLAPTTPASPK
jgi:phospholipid-binding lipoprotein MlaA